MNLHTEKEFIDSSTYFTHKLRNLFNSDKKLFKQIADFLPNLIYISKEIGYNNVNSKYLYFNKNNVIYNAPEMQELLEVGFTLLPKYSCPILLKTIKQKAKVYKVTNDKDVCAKYFQRLTTQGKGTYVITNKIFTNNEDEFLNFSDRVIDLPYIGRIFTKVFEYYHRDFITWQRFQSLTKQEKRIIRLICQGFTSKQIGEYLFISDFTVKQHRKNIYKKLNIKTVAELMNVAIILDLEKSL